MAAVDADRLTVEISDGTVILSGFVSSWVARDAAIEAAWSMPNVTKVEDRIEIAYWWRT
jgi:osmotically-inducible protein OsmY